MRVRGRWFFRGATAAAIGRRWRHVEEAGQDAQRDQRPQEHRAEQRCFEDHGNDQRFAAQITRAVARFGVILQHALRQTSQIAHGHTSAK